MAEINSRPRKTLGYNTPTERFRAATLAGQELTTPEDRAAGTRRRPGRCTRSHFPPRRAGRATLVSPRRSHTRRLQLARPVGPPLLSRLAVEGIVCTFAHVRIFA